MKSRPEIRADLSAGLTTATLLVPQAVAYAMLAELPPLAGLIAAIIPPLLYPLRGESPQLAVGPAALPSLLTAAALGAALGPDAGEAQRLAGAAALTLFVGLWQLLFAVTGTGRLAARLPAAVTVGFTSAAALLIAASQLGPLLGLPGARGALLPALLATTRRLPELAPAAALLGLASLAALSLLKRLRPRWPRLLIVLAAASAAAWLHGGVATLGADALDLSGLRLHLGPLPPSAWLPLIAGGLAVAGDGFIESLAVGRALAAGGPLPRPERELQGLALANLGAAAFGACPASGGLSRSAVNAQAGARSGRASVITAAAVALALLGLGPLLGALPRPALAAVITSAVLGLIKPRELRRIAEARRSDAILLLITGLTTLLVGVLPGLLAGILGALLRGALSGPTSDLAASPPSPMRSPSTRETSSSAGAS